VNRHIPSAPQPSSLLLSEVPWAPLACVALPHAHDRRLCRQCSAVRFRALNPLPPRPDAVRAEAIAAAIRAGGGDVWPAVVRFGISYRYALRIRRGWRPGSVRSAPIPYRSRGWLSGRRPGWSASAEAVA